MTESSADASQLLQDHRPESSLIDCGGDIYETDEQVPYIYDENAETEEKKEERLKMAQELVKRQHPMRNEPLTSALPFLKPLARCCGCLDRRIEDGDSLFVSGDGSGNEGEGEDDSRREEDN